MPGKAGKYLFCPPFHPPDGKRGKGFPVVSKRIFHACGICGVAQKAACQAAIMLSLLRTRMGFSGRMRFAQRSL